MAKEFEVHYQWLGWDDIMKTEIAYHSKENLYHYVDNMLFALTYEGYEFIEITIKKMENL